MIFYYVVLDENFLAWSHMICFVVKILRALAFALAVKVSGSILEGEGVVEGELDPFDEEEGEEVVLLVGFFEEALLGLKVLGPFEELLVGVQVQRLSLKPGLHTILESQPLGLKDVATTSNTGFELKLFVDLTVKDLILGLWWSAGHSKVLVLRLRRSPSWLGPEQDQATRLCWLDSLSLFLKLQNLDSLCWALGLGVKEASYS